MASLRRIVHSPLALALVAFGTAVLASPRPTGQALDLTGHLQAIAVLAGGWGWIGLACARLEGGILSLRLFRAGLALSIFAALPQALARPSDCIACFFWPTPSFYRHVLLALALGWGALAAIEREHPSWPDEARRRLATTARVASLAWLATTAPLLAALALLP